MITKNHPSAYSELFIKAQDVLSKHGSTEDFKKFKISNIDDYFACLAELARIEDEYPESIDPIFTILPATEQTFNIDANTRHIEIPANFAKHGVGVQGDEIAEILYFSIDRYFDAMDLAEMDIIVQWKYEKDNELASNLSATYKKSLTLQPGKIVFGWPITSEVTQRSGNIQFSIRFYRRNADNTQLIYSFSTLTATIKIQAGLDFTLDKSATDLAINKSQMIYNNLRNSKKVNTGYVIAAPAFKASGYKVLIDNELVAVNETKTYDLPITFVSKAEISKDITDEYVSGSGLTYTWHLKNYPNVDLQNRYIYVEDPKTSYNPNEIYYVKSVDGDGKEIYETYYVAADTNPFDDVDENGEDIVLYVRYNAFDPPAAGTYYAVAYNTYTPGSAAYVSSDMWTVPAPQAPIFTYEPADKIVTLMEGEDGAIIKVIPAVQDNGEIEMSWYHSENNNLFGEAVIIENANDSEYLAKEEGYYFLVAINKKNNDTAREVSQSVWVRHDASNPVILSTSGQVILGAPIAVSVQAPSYSTKVTYQWQKYNMNTGEGDNINGATDVEYTPIDVGSYRCVVTNTYKGIAKTAISDWIAVMPA